MRGEYLALTPKTPYQGELPPRARRIQSEKDNTLLKSGTTSACAENTRHDTPRTNPTGNYLRVRGEYVTHAPLSPTIKELPPRARRIRGVTGGTFTLSGTTSACAENTWLRVSMM